MSERLDKSVIEALRQRKKSLDLVQSLVDHNDFEMASSMLAKVAEDLRMMAERLRSIEPPPVQPPPEKISVPVAGPVSKGYLGDEEGPDKLELWLRRLVESAWSAISDPAGMWSEIVNHPRWLAVAGAVAVAGILVGSGYLVFRSHHGLVGEYFVGRDFEELKGRRVDRTIDFRWMRRSPIEGVPADNFSVRWTGSIQIPKTDNYQFSTVSDDGVELFIDQHPLISHWDIHGPAIDNGHIHLTEGIHSIRIRYFQGSGDSVIKLMWKPEGNQQPSLVPMRYLFPSQNTD